MAEQFSASTAFTNMNNNTDGWGDDWGDWNDNAGTTVDTVMSKTIGNVQAAPNAPPNAYFQQQPQHQPQQHPQTQYQTQQMNPIAAGATYLSSGANRMDQHNHNYLPNFSQGNGAYQQQMMAPTTTNQYSTTNYAPPQPAYGQTNNFFNAPSSHPAPGSHRPPSHPPASTTPQLVPTFSQTISDSFDTTAGNSWNWTVPESSNHAQQSVPKVQSEEIVVPKPLPQQPPTQLQQQFEDFPQAGHLPPANAQMQRLKAETLSPQWSIESQVSSSDRSLESDPSGDNRATSQPNTGMPSDEDLASVAKGSLNSGKTAGVESAERQHTSYATPFPTSSVTPSLDGLPDNLDEVLEALSIKHEAIERAFGHTNLESHFRGEQTFPPPPPSIVGTAGPLVNESLSHASKSSSTTPPLPPPPIDNPTVVPLAVGGGPPPPSMSGPPLVSGPPPKAMQIASSNPFKRAGPRSHTAKPGLGVGSSSAPIVPPATNVGGTFFYQQQTQHPALLQPASVEEAHGNNIETLTPENQEILVETRSEQSMENQEIAPNNDRNQYLQTGHLSEDGYGAETPSNSVNSRAALQAVSGSEMDANHGDANDSRLPPPGLSRYVPGQNEQQPEPFVQLSVGQSFPEPPPGLDRMVPGMDLQNVSDLSLERQADGEVSDSTPAAVIMPTAAMSARNDHLHHHHNHLGHHHHERQRVDMSDRNLYRVPGEDDNHNHHNQQRVVPGGGLENERPVPASVSVPSAVPISIIPGASNSVGLINAAATLDMPEEQRELVMDGENPDDQREDSLVGGNAAPIMSATGSGSSAAGASGGPIALETESNVTADTSRMEPSNTSTADESDKGGFYGAGGSSKGAGRREDDNLRRSNKSKSSRDRYDTEDSDYSEHERRRRERETSVGVTGGSGTVAESSSQRHERSRRTGGMTSDRDKDKRKDNGRERDRDRDRERDRDRDRDRDYDYRDRDRERNRYDRDRERYGRNSKYERESRYETDGSKYETERSTRYDKEDKRYGGSTRDDYYRKRDERGPTDDARGAAGRDRDRDTLERRQRKEKERSERYRGDERRKDDRYREGEKRRDRHDRRYDPEDYRTGSRNGTERDRTRDSRERDERKEKDRKYMSAAGGYGMVAAAGTAGAYGPSSGYYDPYSYYAQHQQYYEQLRRTNPQAYAEWYRTYYAQIQASQLQRDLLTTDGRESVHSGRSSANDKERFNRTTPFMHPHGVYNPEEYHRHFNNQSLPSAAATTGAAGPSSLLDQSYLTDVSGQPSSLPPMFHHHPHAFQHQTQQSLQLHQQHQRANTSFAMDRTYHSEAGGYFQPRIDQIDASAIKPDTGTELAMMEPERLTPRKFPEIHPIVSVSAGLLISTKNRLTMNGMADTVKIYSLGYNDASRKLFQTYPGPLVKGVTHKKSVIEFCEEQLRQGPPYSGALALIKSRGNSINSLHSSSLAAGANRSSFALLWNYIILLLRQNGTFVGTDISELLMRNKEEYPFESIHASVARSANISGRNSSLSQAAAEREADARQEGDSEEAGDVPPDGDGAHEILKDSLVEVAPKPLSELEITDKFRSYLLYGNIGEALEWATEHNLWGHALFLASKVDSRQHANVMMKFANKLTLNDPLQTLYQLLSGRTPASVTSVLDEKWGDWRPHLAMLMSNSSAKPELIKKSITTLGDTLLHRGDLYAAHFCYLLSDVAFGRFADVKQDVTVGNNGIIRLVLLGAAHHNRSFREVSTNESIMMTEIYEYARSLNEDRYSIAELQRYKYLLACRMLDQGMQLKCLLYMEQIADQIQYDPYSYDTDFVRKVYTLGDRLKYYDPVMEKALDESVNNTGRGNIYANVEDPQWLKRLNEILLNSSSNGGSQYNNVSDGQATYDYNSYGYAADQSQAVGVVAHQERQLSVTEPPYPSESNDINKQFNEISQQLGQLNLQYSDQQQSEGQQYPSSQPHAAPYELNPAVPNYDQGYESINQQSLIDPTIGQTTKQIMDNYEQQQQQQQHQQFNQYNAYEEQQQQELQQQQGGTSFFTPAPANNETMGSAMTAPYNAGYWGAAGNSEAPKPTISMPNSVSKRPGFGDEADDERMGGRGAAQGAIPGKPQQSSNVAAQAKKNAPAAKDGKPAAGTLGGSAQGSGWFGGIWNKLSLKPKNQMILPDDKNPKIVWDEVTKRWVNTDENEAEAEAYKPPPKMSDLIPAAPAASGGPSQMSPPGAGAGPAAPITQLQETVSAYQQPAASNVMGGNDGTQIRSSQPMGGGNVAGVMQSNVATVNAAGPVGEPTKIPTLQSNMYKMQRNRTLKRSYVDVFNPSGAAPSKPTEPVLAPTVPTLPNTQGSFFVPGGAPNTGGAEQQADTAPEGMPQFYNPNQFAGGPGGYQQ